MALGSGFIDRKAKQGLLAEHIATQWLIDQDFWVFRPLNQVGPIDLIAISPKGRVYLFDVKALAFRQGGYPIHRIRSNFQKLAGVHLLYVDVKSKLVYPRLNGEVYPRGITKAERSSIPH